MPTIENNIPKYTSVKHESFSEMTPTEKSEYKSKVIQDNLKFLDEVAIDPKHQDELTQSQVKEGLKDLKILDGLMSKLENKEGTSDIQTTGQSSSRIDEFSGLFAALSMLVDIANKLRETADLGLAAGIELIGTMATKQKEAITDIAKAEVASAWTSFGVNAFMQGVSLGIQAYGLNHTSNATKTRIEAADVQYGKQSTGEPNTGMDVDVDVETNGTKKSEKGDTDSQTSTKTTGSTDIETSNIETRQRSEAQIQKSNEQVETLQETDSKTKKKSSDSKAVDKEHQAKIMDLEAKLEEITGERWAMLGKTLGSLGQSLGQIAASYMNLELKTEAEKSRINADKDMKVLDNFNQSLRSSSASADKLNDGALNNLQSAMNYAHEARNKIM